MRLLCLVCGCVNARTLTVTEETGLVLLNLTRCVDGLNVSDCERRLELKTVELDLNLDLNGGETQENGEELLLATDLKAHEHS